VPCRAVCDNRRFEKAVASERIYTDVYVGATPLKLEAWNVRVINKSDHRKASFAQSIERDR